MGFQLVSASDDEIVIWHTEHGHIYRYEIRPNASELRTAWFKDIADATQSADSLKADALAFATEEARSRRLLG